LLARDGIRPDLVLCAGDITDRADPVALGQAWADVNDLASSVDSVLIATAGNHDLDSRHGREIDPRGVLFDLEPLFPHNTDSSRADYWSRNYCIVDGPAHDAGVAWRVVTLNTSAFHGLSSDHGAELDFGRVSKRTTDRLAEDLAQRPPAAKQLVLLHHHIEQLPDVDLHEQGQVREVEYLLPFLERTGPWLVIHGHKHRPFFMYARGGAGSAAVFSAASMSSFAWGQASSITANQVHLIRLADPDATGVPELGIAGRFQSWAWRPGVGWTDADTTAGWPGRGGFGWRIDPAALARMLRSKLSGPTSALDYAALLAAFPQIRHLSPVDTENLIRQLDVFGVAASTSSRGEITELRRKLVPIDGGREVAV
jgi:hypothetical protein